MLEPDLPAMAGIETLVHRALAAVCRGVEPAEELDWLAAAEGPVDRVALAAALASPSAADGALSRVAREIDLDEVEVLACALAMAAETDLRVSRALARLQGVGAAAGPSLPTLGLVARMAVRCDLARHGDEVRAAREFHAGAALASGLLCLQNGGRAAVEAALTVPGPVLTALLTGELRRAAEMGGIHVEPLPLPRWRPPPRWQAELDALAARLRGGDGSVLVLRAAGTDEARPFAALLAHALGRRAVALTGALAPQHGAPPARVTEGLEAVLAAVHGVPVMAMDAAPGETWTLARFDAWRGPVVVLANADGELDAGARHRIEWRIPWPDLRERESVWRAALGVDDDGRAARCARRARVGLPALHALVEEAGTGAGGEALESAFREMAPRGARTLAPLAQPLGTRVGEDALVMPDSLRREMELLLVRCEARETLVDELGSAFEARYSPGVKALFVGASGTGKTLAVQWVAMRLGKPLYRVDLSAVSSKYIGETEKNLAQLLARAEGLDAVLMFDEADSLFGARTDVKQANDRFANAQTNYLLARIESFEGIAVLTSNSQARFDHAFLRRLDAIVEFPLPSAAERRALWDVHLGGGAAALGEQQRNRLAAEIDLAGGHIRNVVLGAALAARARDSGAIEWRDVVEASAAEYAKLGRRIPDGLALAGD